MAKLFRDTGPKTIEEHMRRTKRISRKPKERCLVREVGDISRQQLGWYVRNCALSPMAGMLKHIMLERLHRLEGYEDDNDPDLLVPDDDGGSGHVKDARQRSQLRALRIVLRNYVDLPRSDERLAENAVFARDEFELDEVDTEILLLLLRYERNGDLEQFSDEVLQRLHSPSDAIAALIGIEKREARRRIATGGGLMRCGLVSISDVSFCLGLAGQSGCLQLAQPLRKAMHRGYDSREEWVAALIGQPSATPLSWEDFEHLGPTSELAAKVIAGAKTTDAKGVNLLLHGPVGTGKTEFSKALAARTGMTIWSVGETDDDDGEPTRDERLASLKLAQRLLVKRRGALILFDEAEDILAATDSFFGVPAPRTHGGSKVYLNRMIEQNPVPVLWTCNDVGNIDPAVLRRMTLAVEIKTPNQPVRARIWRRVLAQTELKLGEDAVRRLSGRYAAPPAIAASAARAAALSGGGEATIEEAMNGVLQILGIGPRVLDADGDGFDLDLINCREDLTGLVNQLVRPGASRQWSICLYGAPGTGKSQFARYLATRLGMEVMQQRASDLLSCWVGESEKQIAAAFQAARVQRAMLVIDEADSLLADRRNATRSWEVTQVNEMLTWMESHPLPFVCTTNLAEYLDQATIRRFTFKLRFDPMDQTMASRAFERFFGMAAQCPIPEGLTPGDFATVRKKRELLGSENSVVIANWLRDEVAARGVSTTAIGFRPVRVLP
jgi:transitional endoplasmic reticulum ATPase